MMHQVWLPWLEDLRRMVDPSYKTGDPIPKELWIKWWQDGNIPALKVMIEPKFMSNLIKKLVTANKVIC